MKRGIIIPVFIALLSLLCVVSAQAAEAPDIYVFNHHYAGPAGYMGDELFVSLTDILPLTPLGWTVEKDSLDIDFSGKHNGNLKSFKGDGFTLNGKTPGLKVIKQDGLTLVPLKSFVKKLNFKYKEDKDLGTIDVYTTHFVPISKPAPAPMPAGQQAPAAPQPGPGQIPAPETPPAGSQTEGADFPIVIEKFDVKAPTADTALYGSAIVKNISNVEQSVQLLIHFNTQDKREIYVLTKGPYNVLPDKKYIVEDIYWNNPSGLNVTAVLEIVATDPMGNEKRK
ncbi:MAG: hypothetical protein M1269_05435 [Chloroflexi bacterium]|nr:hypothetical protein [Chloroflexota bacterium]